MKFDKNKIKRIDIFKDTLNILENDEYISKMVSLSKINTFIHENNPKSIINLNNKEGNILFSRGRSLKASLLLPKEKGHVNTVVLNFASATNPGGGVINGSNAQEECLCRCSTLYPCLNQKEIFDNFYSYHRNLKNTIYSNKVIYSPEILVFKDDISFPTMLDKENFYFVNIISSPAPNLRNIIDIDDKELLNIFKDRIRHILNVCIGYKNDNIVLGAFGCGAFKNPPNIVAQAFKEILIDENYRYNFNNILFSIFTSPNDTKNFDVFYNTFLSFIS